MDVSPAAFDRLLSLLDPDRDRAGERYELIRQKLTKFFTWRGCAEPEEYADRTMDRVARKVGEGAEIHSGDAYSYFHGVAVNILREYWKESQKVVKKPLDDVILVQKTSSDGELDRQLDCLDGCVKVLPPQHLTLISRYHHGQGGEKIASRNNLAEELNIPLNALRIRAFRIRGALETCVSDCLKK
jgi:DNA-directed RNA polymerase specialized sigma24 family protein